MRELLKETHDNPLLWLLAFVTVVFIVVEHLKPAAHTHLSGLPTRFPSG